MKNGDLMVINPWLMVIYGVWTTINGDLWGFIGDIMGFTLWLWLTVRHGIDGPNRFIDGLPINSMVIFHGELWNNQMVS